MKNRLKSGIGGIFVLVVVAVSLALTSYITVTQKQSTNVKAGSHTCDTYNCTLNLGGLLLDTNNKPVSGTYQFGNVQKCIAHVKIEVRWKTLSANVAQNLAVESQCADKITGTYNRVIYIPDVDQATLTYNVSAEIQPPYGAPVEVVWNGQTLASGCGKACNFTFPINNTGSAGGTDPAGASPIQPARTAHRVGGKVQASDTGAGLPGVSVTIATVDPLGNVLPINGQPTYTTVTDAAGDYAADLALAPGDAYYTRPQSTGPQGYPSAPRTSNNTHSKAAHTGQNTPLGDQSYEQQVVGQSDCASTPGWPNGACNFIYEKAAVAAPVPATNTPSGNTPPVATNTNATRPPETSCLKPLLRYVRTDNSTHFYTSLWSEKGSGDTLWKLEGLMGYVESHDKPHCYSASSQPLYRFLKTGTDLHIYLLNSATPPDASWTLEGVVGHINPAPDGSKHTATLERFYGAVNQDHFYTSDPAEVVGLKSNGGVYGYTYQFVSGYVYGDQALAAGQGTQPAPGTGPPVVIVPNPIDATGTGGVGYASYTRLSLDCTNGFTATSTYNPDPADPTKPNIYYNLEQVTGSAQAGLGKGSLVKQTKILNGATFTNPDVAALAKGKQLLFYVYTYQEGANPAADYTIHGTDISGALEISAAAGKAVPQPYSISCPSTATPDIPGDGTGPKLPVVTVPNVPPGPPVKKDMNIAVRIFLANNSSGSAGNSAPVANVLPVDIEVVNSEHADDAETVNLSMNWKGAGVWEGTYSTAHYPGNRYSFTVWPKKHAKKTICHTGAASPHVLYPTTYGCQQSEGTIELKPGANVIDFSNVKIGAGDLNLSKLRNGHIDSQDLFQINQYLKQPDRNDADAADLNFDGKVNQQDYDLAVWSLQNAPE